MHIFAIPPPGERGADDQKVVRSKFSYELPKGREFYCQFDVAGFVITGISPDGTFKQFKLDLDGGNFEVTRDEMLDLEIT
jgi:hypothetical protein